MDCWVVTLFNGRSSATMKVKDDFACLGVAGWWSVVVTGVGHVAGVGAVGVFTVLSLAEGFDRAGVGSGDGWG